MREISRLPPVKEDNKDAEKLAKSIGQSLVKAVRDIKPPVINPPNIEIHQEEKKGSYLIRINRDDHGRIQSMVVRPYESS